VDLTRDEEDALRGRRGEAMETAYRVLVATGEAMGAAALGGVSWAHLSGVNYNTIGDAGARFLADMAAAGARVRTRTTLNPMGYDSRADHGLPDEFVRGQEGIASSYGQMGVDLSFSCIPYEIFRESDLLPRAGGRVAFAESNAAIYANSVGGLRTNKESAFGALAAALSGKSPVAPPEDPGSVPTVRLRVDSASDLDYGLLGYFAGAAGSRTVNIEGAAEAMGHRSCKSLCAGMGTSGTCSRFSLGARAAGERIDFGREERDAALDSLSTAGSGDMIALGSPQLGAGELASLAAMVGGARFQKRCVVFCARASLEAAEASGDAAGLRRAGCELLADCCACLTPLVSADDVDSVTTSSVKAAYYLSRSNGVGVDLRPISEIVRGEAR